MYTAFHARPEGLRRPTSHKITRRDSPLKVEAAPAAAAMVRSPAASSVASPDNFDRLVAATFRVLSDARTTLGRMRGDRRTK